MRHKKRGFAPEYSALTDQDRIDFGISQSYGGYIGSQIQSPGPQGPAGPPNPPNPIVTGTPGPSGNNVTVNASVNPLYTTYISNLGSVNNIPQAPPPIFTSLSEIFTLSTAPESEQKSLFGINIELPTQFIDSKSFKLEFKNTLLNEKELTELSCGVDSYIIDYMKKTLELNIKISDKFNANTIKNIIKDGFDEILLILLKNTGDTASTITFHYAFVDDFSVSHLKSFAGPLMYRLKLHFDTFA